MGTVVLSVIPGCQGFAVALNAAFIAFDVADGTLDPAHGAMQFGVAVVGAAAGAVTGGLAGTAIQLGVNTMAAGIQYEDGGGFGWSWDSVGHAAKGNLMRFAVQAALQGAGDIGGFGAAEGATNAWTHASSGITQGFMSGYSTRGNLWDFSWDTNNATEHLTSGLAAGLSSAASSSLKAWGKENKTGGFSLADAVAGTEHLNMISSGAIHSGLMTGMYHATGGKGFKNDYSDFNWQSLVFDHRDMGSYLGNRLGEGISNWYDERQNQAAMRDRIEKADKDGTLLEDGSAEYQHMLEELECASNIGNIPQSELEKLNKTNKRIEPLQLQMEEFILLNIREMNGSWRDFDKNNKFTLDDLYNRDEDLLDFEFINTYGVESWDQAGKELNYLNDKINNKTALLSDKLEFFNLKLMMGEKLTPNEMGNLKSIRDTYLKDVNIDFVIDNENVDTMKFRINLTKKFKDTFMQLPYQGKGYYNCASQNNPDEHKWGHYGTVMGILNASERWHNKNPNHPILVNDLSYRRGKNSKLHGGASHKGVDIGWVPEHGFGEMGFVWDPKTKKIKQQLITSNAVYKRQYGGDWNGELGKKNYSYEKSKELLNTFINTAPRGYEVSLILFDQPKMYNHFKEQRVVNSRNFPVVNIDSRRKQHGNHFHINYNRIRKRYSKKYNF